MSSFVKTPGIRSVGTAEKDVNTSEPTKKTTCQVGSEKKVIDPRVSSVADVPPQVIGRC